ncbi:MAG: uracil-DNA glycosylase, partial [Balneolaceae bacterium]
MSEKKEQVLEELIRFLKDERELYGDWNPALHRSMTGSTLQPGHSGTDTTPDESSLETETTEDAENQKNGKTVESDRTSPGRPPQPAAGNSPSLFKPGQPSGLDEQLKSCKTLEELRVFCEKSQDLKTDLEGTNLVFGVGNPNADLILIGEAPGYYEDQQGEPFVGKAGKLLNKILEAIRFQRDDIYIANILKHRPPKNRDPKPEERQKSLPYLMRQIDIIQPKLIFCLGR